MNVQGLNKLAGVEEASQPQTTTSSSFPFPDFNQFPPPPPIPQDVESQTTHSLTPRPSRASLPGNRKPSKRNLNEQRSGNSLRPPSFANPNNNVSTGYTASAHSRDSASQISDTEIPWGTMHPCFPHLNPHVPLNAPEYASTRVIRVQRDWLVAGDLYPAMQNLYPEILAEHMSESEFRAIIETLNPLLKNAFDPYVAQSWFDAIAGILTGFLWDNTGFTASKRKVRSIENWVDGWNREAQMEGREARLIDLRRTGFLTLDIQIPDPHIDVPEGDIQSM